MENYWVLILTLLLVMQMANQIVMYLESDGFSLDQNETYDLQNTPKEVSVSLTWNEITNLVVQAISALGYLELPSTVAMTSTRTEMTLGSATQFEGSRFGDVEPVDAARSLRSSSETSEFRIQEINAFRTPVRHRVTNEILLRHPNHPIKVKMVTSSNQRLVPSLDISGFEFTNFEEAGLDKDFTMDDFRDMLRDMVQNKRNYLGDGHDGYEHKYEPILEKLGRHFSEKLGEPLRVSDVFCIDKSIQNVKETGIHFDTSNYGFFRLWIPTQKMKSHLNLVVGDASKVGGADEVRQVQENGETVYEAALREITWYQKESWKVGEFAAFQGKDVPHGVFKGEGNGGHVIVVTYSYPNTEGKSELYPIENPYEEKLKLQKLKERLAEERKINRARSWGVWALNIIFELYQAI